MGAVVRAGRLVVAPAALVVGCCALVAFGRVVERAEDQQRRASAWSSRTTG
jgi:hypothetical protein